MCLSMLTVSYNRVQFQVMAIKELTLSVSYLHVIFYEVQKSDEQLMVSAVCCPLTEDLGTLLFFPSELFRQNFSLYLVSCFQH